MEAVWAGAVGLLGGDREVAAAAAADLAARYGESHRRYHGIAHARAVVREEYAALDEAAWRAGRTAVMSGLLARDPLYGTPAARRRWEAQAKANIARELDSLTGGAPPR